MHSSILLILACIMGSDYSALATHACDPDATAETNHLLQRLNTLSEKGVMFGHQDDLVYGWNWKYVDGNSDVKDVVGDYPGIVGFELADLELGKNQSLDGVDFAQITKQVKEFNAKKGIITITCHFNNPITGKDAWDNSYKGADKRLVEGGDTHAEWTKRLDLLAAFFLQLTDANGKLIPFIFRPFHEFTNGWSWWSTGTGNSNAEFVALYKSTVNYLRSKGCHNFLLAYNTDIVNSLSEFMAGYVGDDYTDVLSFDVYGSVSQIQTIANFVGPEAQKRGKLAALAEFGTRDSDGFTSIFSVLKKQSMSWGLIWRDTYGQAASYPGLQSSQTADLKKLYADPQGLFLADVAAVE